MNLSDVLLHPDEYDGNIIIGAWRRLIGVDFSVLHVTVFGNFFLGDSFGGIWLLDCWTGQLHRVSENYDKYKTLVATDLEFFNSWFLTDLVASLRDAGMHRQLGLVYSPFVSPGLGGSLTAANFSLAPLHAHVECTAAEVLARLGVR